MRMSAAQPVVTRYLPIPGNGLALASVALGGEGQHQPKVDRNQDGHRSIEALSRTGAVLFHSNPIGTTAFVAQTRVPTRNGVSTLKVTAEAGADIQVITSQGWEIATPVTHGPARLYPVTLERIGVERQVYATTDHAWFVCPASSCKRNESRRPATQRNVLCVCKQMNIKLSDKALRPFATWLREIGRSRTTGWRWRQREWVETINVGGGLYISQQAIDRFNSRAARGDFAKPSCKPAKTQLG